MINIPVKIELPEIYEGTFKKNEWNFLNFIVGPNGTGKSLFSEKLKQQLQLVGNRLPQQHSNPQFRVRLLTAERLAGFERTSYSFFSNSQIREG